MKGSKKPMMKKDMGGMKLNQHKKMAMTGKPYKEGGMMSGKGEKMPKVMSQSERYKKYM